MVEYLEQREETLWVPAVELTWSEEGPIPWGKSLLSVVKEYSFVWQDHKEWLVPLRGVAHTERNINLGEPVQARLTPAASAQADSPAALTAVIKQYLPAEDNASGAKICKPHNVSRGCVGKKCGKGQAHCCDAVLHRTGKACGSTSHSRTGHNTVRHGSVTRQ